MKVGIVSLGCAKNLVDSERMWGVLQREGHELVHPEEAEVVVVNTCGFLGDAVRESVEAIVEAAGLKESGRCRRLVVTGCLVERYGDELRRELPEVDVFCGTGPTPPLEVLLGGPAAATARHPYDPDAPRALLTPPWTAYLKVSEGCSRSCSFCVIPSLRGPMRSRTPDDLAAEAERLAGGGVKELNLVAQDLTSYGRDIGSSLEELLGRLCRIEGVRWIRLLYCYPWGFTPALLDTIASEEKIVNYVDVPLQHINDRILGLMNRKTTSTGLRQLVSTLRERIPRLTLRTTFIVGFPTETEREFRELLDFVEEAHFERVGVFTYSHEEGTAAAALEDNVPPEEKEERRERLMELQASISQRHNAALVGEELEALIERRDGARWEARLASQAPEVDGVTYVESTAPLRPGDIVPVTVTAADTYDLHAVAAPRRGRTPSPRPQAAQRT